MRNKSSRTWVKQRNMSPKIIKNISSRIEPFSPCKFTQVATKRSVVDPILTPDHSLYLSIFRLDRLGVRSCHGINKVDPVIYGEMMIPLRKNPQVVIGSP